MNSQGRRMFNLGLGPGALAFIGTSGKEDIARVRQLMNQFDNRPENWVPAWMEECQVPRALIEYWENFHHS
jgi:hypothetical protein